MLFIITSWGHLTMQWLVSSKRMFIFLPKTNHSKALVATCGRPALNGGSVAALSCEETHVSYTYFTYNVYIFVYLLPGYSAIRQEMQTIKRKGQDCNNQDNARVITIMSPTQLSLYLTQSLRNRENWPPSNTCISAVGRLHDPYQVARTHLQMSQKALSNDRRA